MGRKKSTGWGGLLLLVIVGLFAIPKEVWAFIGVVVAIWIAVVVVRRSKAAASRTPTQSVAHEVAADVSPKITVSIRSIGGRSGSPDPRVISERCWVPPGKAISVANFQLSDGMVYVGSRLPSVGGSDIEPAAIDPTLSVAGTGSGPRMQYWPSYSNISPEARGEYLNWLATGRRQPEVQLGCVFLFFYGLERRLLHDVDSTPEEVSGERARLVAEIEALLKVYGESGSFHSYASGLLDVLTIRERSSTKLYASAPPEPSGVRELRLTHKIALGQLAVDGVPLPPPWAYSWVKHDELGPRRKAAQRCPEEFRQIFTAMYTQRYGHGMTLSVNKTRLKVVYRPASSSFSTSIALEASGLPDVAVQKGPIEELRNLAAEASDALDPYSRFIGRHPEKSSAMDARALLPPVLWPRESLASLANWLRKRGVNQEPQVCALKDLLSHFPEWTTLNRERAVGLSTALEYLGIGIDPDARWKGPVPAEESAVALFRVDRESRGKGPSAAYFGAALTLQLAAAVAAADGVSTEEQKYLEESIDQMVHLEAHERLRLHAHLKWLIVVQPSPASAKAQIATLTMPQRKAIAALMVTIAHLDGKQTAAEMKVLAKIYRLLDLPAEALYRDAHAAAAEPVTVSLPEASSKRFTIPKPPVKETTAGLLDSQRIQQLQEESARISAMLGTIFTSSDEPARAEDGDVSAGTPEAIAGLDKEHSEFSSFLLSRSSWSRAELEDLATDRGMMLDGALETVNEAFMDNYGEPLLEGNDPVLINQGLARPVEA